MFESTLFNFSNVKRMRIKAAQPAFKYKKLPSAGKIQKEKICLSKVRFLRFKNQERNKHTLLYIYLFNFYIAIYTFSMYKTVPVLES